MPHFDFSVVIGTCNRADYLEGCLKPLMEPAAEGLDVVVVDDGSTDGSQEVLRRLAGQSCGARLRVIRQDNAGVSVARNRGMETVATPFVVFLDDDDRWFPWTAETIQTLVQQAPDAAMMLLQIATFTEESQLSQVSRSPLEVVSSPSFFDFYLDPPTAIYGSCNVCVRRDAFQAVGGFAPELRASEDIDLFFRMSGQGRVVTAVAPVLVGYRTDTPQSLSKNSLRQLEAARFFLDRYLQGGLEGAPETIRAAVARFVMIRFWTLFNSGETHLTGLLLKDASRLLVAEKGRLFVHRLRLVLLKRRLMLQ